MYAFIICWLWVGLILGVSFIATPAKFLAPSLSLSEALEVGRATFNVFRWIELSMFLMLIVSLSQHAVYRYLKCWIAVIILVLLLGIHYIWLQPTLDDRVQLIIEGYQVEHSVKHNIYILVECLKVLTLIIIGYLFKKSFLNHLLENRSYV